MPIFSIYRFVMLMYKIRSEWSSYGHARRNRHWAVSLTHQLSSSPMMAISGFWHLGAVPWGCMTTARSWPRISNLSRMLNRDESAGSRLLMAMWTLKDSARWCPPSGHLGGLSSRWVIMISKIQRMIWVQIHQSFSNAWKEQHQCCILLTSRGIVYGYQLVKHHYKR